MKAFKVRRNGEHYFRVELPRDFSPDAKRKSVVARTRHEALEKAQELLERKKKGLKIDESRSSLSEFLREFLHFYQSEGGVSFGPGKTIATTLKKTSFPVWAASR
jgi:hypothetical protein